MRHLRLSLCATKKDGDGTRVADAKARAKALPHGVKGSGRPSCLEVVHVDHQERMRRRIKIHAWPVRYGLQTTRDHCVTAMFLQITPRIRVAVQCEAERANRPLECAPTLRAGLFRKFNPSGGALKFGLKVGLHRICLLENMSWEQGEGVDDTRRLHIGRRSAKLPERAA